MLAAGQINVEQTTALLKALGPSQAEEMAAAPERRPAPDDAARPAAPRPPDPPPAAPRNRSRGPRFLRINVVTDEPGDKGNVKIAVPFALAKFALRFMPEEARTGLNEHGIDLKSLLEGLDDELIEGELLNIETSKEDGSGRAHITIEVN